jgi:DNA modification methylase
MSVRTVTIGPATLYCGDALEIVPTLPKVDAVITDPPYGVLDEEWDSMTFRELARFTMGWVSQVRAKSDVLVSFFAVDTRAALDPLLQMVYEDVRQLVWNKGGGRVADGGLFYSFEPIYLCQPPTKWEVVEPKTLAVAQLIASARERAGLSRGAVDMQVRGKKTGLCYRWEEAACLPTLEQAHKLRQILPLGVDFDQTYTAALLARDQVMASARAKTSENAARGLDVFTYPPTQGGPDRHPTEKPLALMGDLVQVVTDPGQVVLDPFMGRGTTGVACVQLGRPFIGIERDPGHFDNACRRIEQAVAQGQLFTPEQSKQVQESLL